MEPTRSNSRSRLVKVGIIRDLDFRAEGLEFRVGFICFLNAKP